MKKIKMKKTLAVALVAAVGITTGAQAVSAAVTVNRPAYGYETKLNVNAKPTEGDLSRKLVGYFPSWAYASDQQAHFDAADLQWGQLTHIQYSFGFIDEQTHKLYVDDSATKEDFSGYDIRYKGEKVELDSSKPYKGHFNLLETMRDKYSPDTKLMLSVGGWTGCKGFYPMIKTDEGIETFANSCIDFLKTYDFDGIDIDFEYPSAQPLSGNTDQDGVYSESMRPILNERYNLLIRVLRQKIDELSAQRNRKYQLTAAVTASGWVLAGITDNSYAQYLDFLSCMSYDYHGGWNQYVENQAGIYSDPADNETAQSAMPYLSMDWTFKFYNAVMPSERILMGIPYYTRGWENVQGGDGTGLHGTAGTSSGATAATGIYNIWGDPKNGDDPNSDKIPAGANPLWHVKNLLEEDPNLKECWDDVQKVPHVWQSEKKVFLSYENERSMEERLKYIKEHNLGGALIWVMNGDYGLNPNYEPGSTDPNKGKYCFGNTLTTVLSDGLKAMGDCKKSTEEDFSNVTPIDATITTSTMMDYPNTEVVFNVTNNTGKEIGKGWTLEFEAPKTFVSNGAEMGTAQVTDIPNSDLVKVKLTSTDYKGIGAGETVSTLKFKYKVCIPEIKNLRLNGKVPTNVSVNGNYLPSLSGAGDMTVSVGGKLDLLSGIKSTDREDGDLTSQVGVVGEDKVDTSKPGIYNVGYYVSDSTGFMVKNESNIYVLPAEYSNVPVWEAKAYSEQNPKVMYKGAIYQASAWYVPATEVPGESSIWKKLESIPDYRTTLVYPDSQQDVITIAKLASRYNAMKGQSLYDAKYDLNSDNIIDVYDIVKVASSMK